MTLWTLPYTGPGDVLRTTALRMRALPQRPWCAALCLLVLAGWPVDSALAADDTAVVRIAGVTYLGDLPTTIADEGNLFRAQGLDATVQYNESGHENLRRLRAGDTDFALMALTPIVLDRMADATPGRDDDPVILASLVHSTRLNAVVPAPAAGIEQPEDLKGRRVALPKGTSAEFVWWLFAQFHGFDPGAVQLLDMPVSKIAGALRDGETDAAVVWEPWLSRLRQSTPDPLRVMDGSNIYTAQWVLVSQRARARAHPEQARAILAAYREAIERIGQDPNAAIRTYARRAQVDETALQRNWLALEYALNLNWSIVATLQQQFDWARQSGRQLQSGPIHIMDLLETAPLRSLEPARVGIPPPADMQEPQP